MLISTELGCTQTSTSFSDIIINQCNAIADGLISGFGQFAHDPKYLNQTVQIFNQQKIPARFSDAVVLRRIETQKLDDIWQFPLNMTAETTVPLPWTICEATKRGNGQGQNSYEYNIMRIIDFIGRNYVRIILPEVDTSSIRDKSVQSDGSIFRRDKRHMYLGAWHRDLIPRIIQKVSFYPRQNAHKLFEYSGYDIFIYNILFGNAAKKMNDLMAGEDMFELCYDPFRTHGSALGQATYKGIDNNDDFLTTTSGSFTSISSAQESTLGIDSFTDQWIHDTYMSGKQFQEIYRKNVWYEAPVARNYHARHSIHSRRFIHSAKIIVFPLDILPFGYSIASSLPTAALAGDCGYISIDIYTDWFDRAFYLTKLSDIPVLFPVVNHQHFVPGDVCYTIPSTKSVSSDVFAAAQLDSQRALQPYRITAGYKKEFVSPTESSVYLKVGTAGSPTSAAAFTDNREGGKTLSAFVAGGDPGDITKFYLGWVNPNSIGKFGRKDFWDFLSGRNPERWAATSESVASQADYEGVASAISNSHMVTPESVVNGANPTLLEGVIPATVYPSATAAAGTAFDRHAWTQYTTSNQASFVDTLGVQGPSGSTPAGFNFKNLPIQSGNTTTTVTSFGADVLASEEDMIFKPSQLMDNTWVTSRTNSFQIKLLQVGYQTMPSIRQFLSKLPNIYVTTEWNDDKKISMTQAQQTTFNINNDLYIQAIMFWFIPVDSNGIEHLRLYPQHLLNHEMPIIPGLRIANEQSQGTTTYDWHLMNEITPHLLGLYNPLLENMGLISFTPKLAANQLPLAYYDTNISGYITVNVLADESQTAQTTSNFNLKSGYLSVKSIGVNGVASVNLNLYRLIF